MATNRDFTLKRKNGDDIDILYPTTRWAQVEEKPTTFTPTAHSHGNITNGGAIGSTANLMVKTGTSGKLTTLPAGTTSQFLRGDGTWATPADSTTLTSLGITATSTELNYTKGVTSNIQTQLSNKVDKASGKGLSSNDYTTAEKNKLTGIASGAEVNVQADWNVTNTSSDAFIKNKPTTFTPSSHTHGISDIPNLEIALDGKANSSHTHTIANVTNLQTTLNGKANSSHTHGISDVTNLQTTLDNKASWTQVWSGSTNLNSYRSGWYPAAVPSNSYVGKRIAIEVQYGTGTSYTSKIIFGVLGSSSVVTASTSISRGIGWSYFDGTNLRVKTLYAYTPTGTSTAIYVGNLKTLFGSFTGTTIDWKTSHSETLYMKKIWVIE